MRLRDLAIAIVLVSATTSCRAQRVVGGQIDKQFDFVAIEATAHTDDRLVRVSGHLYGLPNTADRIDGVKLVNGRDTITANDIDGVDFKRWFQWEEEGVIDLEIDFPAKRGKAIPKVTGKSQLIFVTSKGEKQFIPTKLSGK